MKHRLLLVAAVVAAVACSCAREEQWWQLRGAVLSVEDLQSVDWPKIARDCGINTLDAPVKVKPDKDIFLEFAPFYRNIEHPLSELDALPPEGSGQMTHGQNLKYLEDNLKVFPAETTVILDYWLDVSMCSGWKKPAVQLPWHPEVVRDDLATYKKYGIRNATSFAVYMDDAYFESYPSLAPLKEYGACFED